MSQLSSKTMRTKNKHLVGAGITTQTMSQGHDTEVAHTMSTAKNILTHGDGMTVIAEGNSQS